jgi:hypothetical protein
MIRQGTKAGGLLAAIAKSLVFVLACLASANGQVTVGDRFNMTMNGSVGAVYEGSFGDHIGSSHDMGIAANGVLDGYYFHPQFLSFQVRPYYDRAESNSESQTITRGSGVDSSLNLFGGSHFPGSITYGRDFSSNREFRIAGIPSILGNSSGSNFDIAWSALFDGLPSIHASYSIADSTSTLLGTASQSKSASRNFSLNTNYDVGGFSLHGIVTHYNTDFLSPDFLTAESIANTSSSTNYGVTATRKLPLSGSLGLGWSRTNSESGISQFTSNSYSASATFTPVQRFSISEYCSYTTNVIAALAQSLGVDNISPLAKLDSNSDAIYINTTGTLSVAHGLSLSGYLNHRIMHLQGHDSVNTQYGGTVNFQKANTFLGFLRFSVGVVDTATKEGNSAVGLVTNLGMMRRFGLWEATADFIYSQYTQTLFNIVTTSNYSYGGTLRRKINSSTSWNASFRQSRSGLTAQDGNYNISESFTTSLSWRRNTFSGVYSKSNGAALLRTDGTLTPTPLGSIISNDFMTFDARSFGINASTRLLRKLTLSGGYTNVSSNAIRKELGTFNNGNRFYSRLELRMRRLTILTGFDHAVQESSAVLGGPRTINSYYVSLSRWFNIL